MGAINPASNSDELREREHRLRREHMEAFEVWYDADRDFQKAASFAHVSDRTIRLWADWWDWHKEADRRDAEVARRVAKVSVSRKAEMIERHRLAGQLMVHRGTQFFRNQDSKETPITRTADAINAIAKGVEIEAKAEGLPPWIFELLNADDETLAAIVRQAASEQSGDGGDRWTAQIAAGDGESTVIDGDAYQPTDRGTDAPTA